MEKNNLSQVKDIVSNYKRLIIRIWLIVMTVITAIETNSFAG